MSAAREAPLVLKIGGRALDAPGAGAELARELADLGGGVVVVHGGGGEVSDWCARLGIAPRFEGGRRVTDPASLEVAVAVLAGLANKRLVAALRAAGIEALGLAALEAGIEAAPRLDPPGLGAVGRVASVDAAPLGALLERGLTPVLSSIGAAGGALLNLNADEVAAAAAGALRARLLVLLSDAAGVRIEGRVLATAGVAEVEALLDHPEVRDGMRPKLEAARGALDGGAARACIAAWSGPGTLAALLEGRGACTEIVADLPAPERW